MKIIIPALAHDCPAAMALATNGYSPKTVIMEDDYHYASLFKHLWDSHEDFIIVEHDIVPWPGAITSLGDCLSHWCGFQYPNYQGAWGGGLGCVRFTGAFTKAFPKIADELENTIWNHLDTAVFELIRAATEYDYFHVHTPPVAHLKTLDKLT